MKKKTFKKEDRVYLAREGKKFIHTVTWVKGDYIRVNHSPVNHHYIHWIKANNHGMKGAKNERA